jgi:hypothetical protein
MFRNIICLAIVLTFFSLIEGQSIEYNAVIAGINDYLPIQNNLNWAVKDAQDIRYTLETHQSWQDANITLLTNNQAIQSTIVNDLANMPRTSGKTNLFYFSGHGSEYGLLTYDDTYLIFLSPYVLDQYLGYQGFNQFCVIADACSSGVFTEEMTKGVILAACESDEIASEGLGFQNGTFTYFLLNGLSNNAADDNSDGLLSAEELYAHAHPLTTSHDPYMHPQIGDNFSGDLVLNYNIYVPQQYASISSALSASHSGQTVILTSNQTVSSNLTVPSGVTLKINPSLTLTFNSGAKLIVNGMLNAVGTSSNPITFNFGSPNSSTQNGIVLNSGSNGTINYCQIRNAYRGIYENNVSVNITNSAISSCTDGIYLYTSNPVIQDCNIHNNSNAGINLTYSGSSTSIKENYIQNNGTGIYCSTNSQPVIGNSSTQVGNFINNNSYGIIVANNAIPVVGSSSNGGYNNLINSTNNILNTTNNTVYAQNNWWGTTNPANFLISGGPVTYSPYRSTAASIPTLL